MDLGELQAAHDQIMDGAISQPVIGAGLEQAGVTRFAAPEVGQEVGATVSAPTLGQP